MGEKAGEAIGLETRLSRLESIVAALEREDLELDQALSLFEEGIGHLREAQRVIAQAELRVDRLVEDASGEPVAEPMEHGDG